MLLEDRVHGAEEAYPERRFSDGPVVLKEWDVIGEIWSSPKNLVDKVYSKFDPLVRFFLYVNP